MGLGPPICMKCYRIMDYHDKGVVVWKCDLCGNENIDGGLFEMTDEFLSKMDVRWGTDYLRRCKDFQESIKR